MVLATIRTPQFHVEVFPKVMIKRRVIIQGCIVTLDHDSTLHCDPGS